MDGRPAGCVGILQDCQVPGLIDIRDLKSKEPQLSMTKLYELYGHIFTTKPDVIILNETWLKKSI